VTRLSDERMCRGREFQLLGDDTQKAREAKDDLTEEENRCESCRAGLTSRLQLAIRIF